MTGPLTPILAQTSHMASTSKAPSRTPGEANSTVFVAAPNKAYSSAPTMGVSAAPRYRAIPSMVITSSRLEPGDVAAASAARATVSVPVEQPTRKRARYSSTRLLHGTARAKHPFPATPTARATRRALREEYLVTATPRARPERKRPAEKMETATSRSFGVPPRPVSTMLRSMPRTTPREDSASSSTMRNTATEEKSLRRWPSTGARRLPAWSGVVAS